MKSLKIYLLVILVFSLMSCEKYLEKEPRILASIQTAEQLEALVNNATQFTYQANQTANYSTDDTEISMDLYRNATAVIPLSSIYHYIFNVDQIIELANDGFWNSEYAKIFTANLILDYADKVTGDAASIARSKSDAYLIRAYAYWQLVNYYCMPYSEANLESAGIPLKKTTSYDEPLKRVSLKETYAQIIADLVEARKTAPDEVAPLLRWRSSKKAIDAFLSRIYLFTADYDKCLEYANSALLSTNTKLVNFNTLEAGTPMNFPNPAVTLNYSILNNYAASKFLFWDEFYFTRFVNNSNQWNIPSQALISLFDKQKDLRYKYFLINNSNRRFGILTPTTYRYCVFNDGRYIAEGPSVAEVLLNKAEAAARNGEINTAMNAVNMLREKRMSVTSDLAASGKEEAVIKVLEERRRELPFAFRWLDIRRFAVNNDPADDVSISRTFFKVNNGDVDFSSTQNYQLPVNSRRYMVPINATEIANSRGQIIQNTY